jgi:tellurite resistance protein TerC
MTLLWLGSISFITLLLVLDLGVFRRRAETLNIKEAAISTAIWVIIALLFNGFIYLKLGSQPALDFFIGYLVEYSLSIDNLFVFMLIFSYFKVPEQYQQRVLFFGIMGAILMRGAFILIGATLLENFHWTIYLLGALLVLSGFKLFNQNNQQLEPENNIVFKTFKRLIPIHSQYDGQKFLTHVNGTLMATPLLLVLVSVEVSDLIFAVDSIPAIFGITTDPYIVFTSNIFAVLGLRSLYFLLSGSMNKVALLQYGLALILIFVGLKMLLSSILPISSVTSLIVISVILLGSIIGSFLINRNANNNGVD